MGVQIKYVFLLYTLKKSASDLNTKTHVHVHEADQTKEFSTYGREAAPQWTKCITAIQLPVRFCFIMFIISC